MESVTRNRKWLHAARFVDFLHLAVVVPYMMFGRDLSRDIAGETGEHIWFAFLFCTLTLQVITLGCPMVVLASWMRRKHDPSYAVGGSFTIIIYERYGRVKGVTITAGVLFVLVALASLLLK